MAALPHNRPSEPDAGATPAPDASVASELGQVTPIVLVGGRSRRFGEGRDKLREPVGRAPGAAARGPGAWLVDRPIAALRQVFGPRVGAVGDCDPQVAARFDRIIEDQHPGSGPIGGIISALAAAEGPVFVLAGDLVAITEAEVRAVATAFDADRAWPGGAGGAGLQPAGDPSLLSPLAIMAMTDRPEPCCALYTAEALPILEARLTRGERSLHDALPADRVRLVPLPAERLANINTPADLGR